MDHYFLNELSFNLINLNYILITDQRLMAMEIISYSSSSCCYPVNQGRNLGGKSSDSQSKVSNFRNPRLLSSAKLIYKSGNLGLYKPDRLFLRNFRSLNSKVLAGNYEGYVIGAEDEARSISGGREGSATRVLIPGLPEESGESPAEITGCFWEWKPKLRVHYDKAGCEKHELSGGVVSPGIRGRLVSLREAIEGFSRARHVDAVRRPCSDG